MKSSMRLSQRLRAFARRSRSDRALLLHAFALHAAIAVFCRLLPFGWLTGALARAYPLRGSGGDASAEARAIWAATTAAAFCPLGSTCLTTALTTRCLLRRIGYDAVLRFGVRPETRTPFAAHAWLEAAGHTIPGLPSAQDHLLLN